MLAVILLLVLGSGCTRNRDSVLPPSPAARASSTDEAFPPGLPPIGKWLIAADGVPAHWLNAPYHGKNLREPINVIFLDHAATSAADATNRLLRALAQAGFPLRKGHSSGYSAYVGGVAYHQFPEEPKTAISDEPFEVNNNHGRLFGPVRTATGAYLCTAAFSRERVAPLEQVKHAYVSFNRARDTLAQHLAQHTTFKLTGFVPLDNALLDETALTTGDHDGLAVLLEAKP